MTSRLRSTVSGCMPWGKITAALALQISSSLLPSSCRTSLGR